MKRMLWLVVGPGMKWQSMRHAASAIESIDYIISLILNMARKLSNERRRISSSDANNFAIISEMLARE
jgi:hypothetical protein